MTDEQIRKQFNLTKPVWYFMIGNRGWYGWRFYFGKTLGYWTLNIGTPFFDCGRAW